MNQDEQSDIIRYLRRNGRELKGSKYIAEMVELAHQIQDIPENRVKVLAALQKHRDEITTQADAWHGLVDRLGPEGTWPTP